MQLVTTTERKQTKMYHCPAVYEPYTWDWGESYKVSLFSSMVDKSGDVTNL